MHRQTHKNKPVKSFGSFDSFKFDGRERKNNAVSHVETAYGKDFGVPEVIRTPDLSLRSMAYHVIHGSDVTSNIIPYAE